MSLNDVADRFNTGTYSVSRRDSGTYSSGVYVKAAPSVINVEASIQPVTGEKLMPESEGQNSDDTRIMYTKTYIRTREASDGGDPDEVTVDGDVYVAVSSKKWSGFRGNGSGDLYEITLSRVWT